MDMIICTSHILNELGRFLFYFVFAGNKPFSVKNTEKLTIEYSKHEIQVTVNSSGSPVVTVDSAFYHAVMDLLGREEMPLNKRTLVEFNYYYHSKDAKDEENEDSSCKPLIIFKFTGQVMKELMEYHQRKLASNKRWEI